MQLRVDAREGTGSQPRLPRWHTGAREGGREPKGGRERHLEARDHRERSPEARVWKETDERLPELPGHSAPAVGSRLLASLH